MTATVNPSDQDRQRLKQAKRRAKEAGIKVVEVTAAAGRPELAARRAGVEKRFATVSELERWLDRVAGAATGEQP